MISSSCAMKTMTTTPSSPRLSIYAGDPIIGGRLVPHGDGRLPADFPERLVQLKETAGVTWDEFAMLLGVELKQVLRWTQGTEPSGGAHHSLVSLARWVPGGLDILMGDDFLNPPQGGVSRCPASAYTATGSRPTS